MKNKDFILIGLVIIIISAIAFYSMNKRAKKMAGVIKNSIISRARVIDTKYSGNRNSSLKLIIEYKYLNTKYETEEVKYELQTSCPLINKQFPIILDSLDAKKSYILVSPNDFSKFQLSFPDSLDWIKKYIRN